MRTAFVAFFLVTIIGSVAERANAVPVFARKYNTTCFTCHTTPPLLNDFGLRFQANGYQLPGTLEKYAQADQPSFLLGMVAQPMFQYSETKDNLGATPTSTSTSFSGIEVALFTSASLGSHFSFFTGLPIDYFSGLPTTINVETANLIYTDALNDGTGSLNFRVGEFRFSIPYQHPVILANQDPLVYTYDPFAGKNNLAPANRLSFADPNFGISAFGMIPGIAEGLRYDFGFSGGTNSDIDLKTSKAYFGALNQTVYVDNAPLRFGAFYYGGSQDIIGTAHFSRSFIAPRSGSPGIIDTIPEPDSLVSSSWTNHSSRVGLNLEMTDPWTKRLDFYSQYVVGNDDHADSLQGGYSMSGWFAGMNVIIFPEKFYVYGRYDVLKVTETNDNINQIDVGFQYHLLPNAFVTAVYTIKHETYPTLVGSDGTTTQSAFDQTSTSAGIGIRFGF